MIQRQEINLYQSIFHKQSTPFSARIIVRLALFQVALLVIIQAYLSWDINRARASLQAVEQREAMVQEQVLQLQSHRGRPSQQHLYQKVTQLERDIADKQSFIAALLAYGPIGQDGFADQLRGLAQYHQPGLWLTRIDLVDGGRWVLLAGNTRQASHLPSYLQRLEQHPAFAGARFGEIDMTVAESVAPLAFSMSRPEP